jgi:NodT family efflux transporter outer membrane factor (OMF) lipoprotein
MSPRRLTHTTLAAVAALAAGCAAGPDYRTPAPPDVDRYTAEPLAGQTASAATAGGAAQRLVAGADVPERWWTLFGSDTLDALVAAALDHNPDVQAADAALRAARESAAAQRGAYLPTVDAQYAPARQKTAAPVASGAASGASLYTLHTAQLNIAYAADVFGGTRRQVQAAEAQADVARFQAQAARLTLAANVVAAAIQEASLRAQRDATQELVTLARAQLDTARRQRQAGQVALADVAVQEASLAQVEAGLPALDKQLAQQRDLLAVLAGRYPAEGSGLRSGQRFDFGALALPEELPVNVPARLVERRPDVRAAEAQLRAASARIGAAQAARLPDITLGAALGSSALDAGTLFRTGTGFWSIGANLVQPLFHGGALAHQQRAAEAEYDQSAAQYRGTVLAAFRDVADALHAIEADARTLRAALAADQAARKSLAIATRQRELGAVGQPAVVQAQQGVQQAAIALVQARAARYADTVALFQALGGGWQDAASR